MDDLRPRVSKRVRGFVFRPYKPKKDKDGAVMRKEFTRLIVAIFYSLIGLALFILISCGGGGDGGGSAATTTTVLPTPSYSGTWLFEGVLGINDCNLNLPATFTSNPKVYHTGNNVVVISGTGTLTGHTNDKDGFDVTSPVTTDSNGCSGAAAYHFEGASDGNADAGFGMAVQCGNSPICSVGYGGPAVRQSLETAISIEAESDSTLDSLMNNCFQKTFEQSLDSSKEGLPLDEEGLKAAATDVAKSAIGEITKDSTVR